MTTLGAETCRLLLYNKITFMHSSAFVGLFFNFTQLISTSDHDKLRECSARIITTMADVGCCSIGSVDGKSIIFVEEFGVTCQYVRCK
jgi:hypothetical protein